ncbi:MAG: hypothetical protein Q7S27_01260 [Nanoarchaeota archaeon]|nr:hypothetical protein [Nanoarchaeota archaeon]
MMNQEEIDRIVAKNPFISRFLYTRESDVNGNYYYISIQNTIRRRALLDLHCGKRKLIIKERATLLIKNEEGQYVEDRKYWLPGHLTVCTECGRSKEHYALIETNNFEHLKVTTLDLDRLREKNLIGLPFEEVQPVEIF